MPWAGSVSNTLFSKKKYLQNWCHSHHSQPHFWRFHTYSLFALVRIRDQLVAMLHITSSFVCVHTAALQVDQNVWCVRKLLSNWSKFRKREKRQTQSLLLILRSGTLRVVVFMTQTYNCVLFFGQIYITAVWQKVHSFKSVCKYTCVI